MQRRNQVQKNDMVIDKGVEEDMNGRKRIKLTKRNEYNLSLFPFVECL